MESMTFIICMLSPAIVFGILFVIAMKVSGIGKQKDSVKDAIENSVICLGNTFDVMSGNKPPESILETVEGRRLQKFKGTAIVCDGYLQPVYNNKVTARFRNWDGVEREVEVDIHPEVAIKHTGHKIKVYVDAKDVNIAKTDREEILRTIETLEGN